MKIIVDAFGGDNAPLEIIKGCVNARKKQDVDILLSGDTKTIKKVASENKIDLDGIELLQADDVFSMETQPTEIIKSGKNTSMAVGLSALAEGRGDAFISAGSTGALLVGATFIVKRIKGVKRPAIAAVLPSAEGPFILVDTGANVECTAPMLCQFAHLGNVYMQKVLDMEQPRVALANIGSERTKGTKLQIEAYEALEKMEGIHFTGNVEIRDIPFGKADVVVADGFTGNVILKMYEGTAKMISNKVKALFTKNLFTAISYLGVHSGVKDFKEQMNYKKYGGAPIVGVRKTVFKAHGSSDAYAIENAILQTIKCVENDIPKAIEAALSEEKNGTVSE